MVAPTSLASIPAGGSPLEFGQYLNGNLAGVTEQINAVIANPGSGEAPAEGGEQEGGAGIVSGLTSGIPLVGGVTEGVHKVVSSVPVVGDVLGGLF